MHIDVALAQARTRIPASEARLLLGEVLGKPAAWLMAHGDRELRANDVEQFFGRVQRRSNGEPVAYLIGRREFYGRDFLVAPGVLIPRPETELLVDVAGPQVDAGRTAPAGFRHTTGAHPGTAQAKSRSRAILDLGTGSGCIAISIALEFPGSRVTAVDASESALDIAARNAVQLNATLGLIQSDWFSALGDARFDLIVSNPPYIRAGDPHLNQGDLRHEPQAALASGTDGLEALRIIIGQAPAHLVAGGQLWVEHGHDQAGEVRALLRSAGFVDVISRRDLAGIERISGGAFGAQE